MKNTQRSMSWLDRAQNALDQAPFRWWLPLVIAPILLFTLEVALVLLDGGQAALADAPLIISAAYAALPSFIFAFVYFLDTKAESAVIRLAPLIREPISIEELSFTISHMPAKPALVATVLGFAGFVILRTVADVTGDIVLTGTTMITRWVRLTEGSVFWMLNGVTIYHSVRQLSIIDKIFHRHVEADLLNQSPLYGLTSVSTYTAIGFALPISIIFFFVLPYVPTDPLSIGLFSGNILLTTVILVSPVYRLHLELAEDKDRRMNANTTSLNKLLQQLHTVIQNDMDDELSELEAAYNILQGERDLIRKARTWPWASGSVRSVLAALMLPTLVWLIQEVLGFIIN